MVEHPLTYLWFAVIALWIVSSFIVCVIKYKRHYLSPKSWSLDRRATPWLINHLAHSQIATPMGFSQWKFFLEIFCLHTALDLCMMLLWSKHSFLFSFFCRFMETKGEEMWLIKVCQLRFAWILLKTYCGWCYLNVSVVLWKYSFVREVEWVIL